jgi:peptidyl-lysine (3S)-dioxygenase / protease
MDRTPPLDPITELLTTYNELNSTHIDTLSSPPSALEFLRSVARNRPFVVRGGASDWKATRTWDIETLKRLLDGQSIQVAVTPHGYLYPFAFCLFDTYLPRDTYAKEPRNADAPTKNQDGELIFVKPWEEQQSFPEFIDFISSQELRSPSSSGSEVRYAQTRSSHVIPFSPLSSLLPL